LQVGITTLMVMFILLKKEAESNPLSRGFVAYIMNTMRSIPPVLFSHSYFLQLDPKQLAAAQPYPPLGTLYAAAFLRENGFPVALFDTMFCKDPALVTEALDKQQPGIFVLYDDGFNYLTKMCLTNMREAAFSMIRIAKQKGCMVIVCSSDATDHFQEYLQEGADFIILGEGEISLLELVTAINNRNIDLTSIKGLAFLQEGQVLKTAPRPVLRDLDSLPMAAWDLINMEEYRHTWMQSSGYFSLNMGTTRGCPYKCNWCAKPIYGNRYNARSPQQVVAELQYLHSLSNFDHIWFCDDIFGLKPGWVAEFAALLQQTDLRFRFKIQSRADLLTKPAYVQDLAAAGCENVWMGAESGSQKVLDAMDKGITIQEIHTATGLLKQHGIHPSFFIQFGYPGETRSDIDLTISMINRLLPYEIGISVSYPLPGTPFYEKVKEQLKQKANWTDSDELSLMFSNTYKPAFYRQLHRYVHKSYRKHLALQSLAQLLKHPARISRQGIRKAASLAWYLPAALIARKKLESLQA